MPKPGPANPSSPAPPTAATLEPVSLSRRIGLGAGLVLLALAAYAPLLDPGWISDAPRGWIGFDDTTYVSENPAMRRAAGLWRIWFDPLSQPQYYPLTFTTFWCEYQLWQDWPVGYQIVNVLLHAASAVLLWRLLGRLDVPGAWLIAAIFVVHPLHAASVAWIAERKNVLSGLLCLACALLVVRWARRGGRLAFVGALACFVAALAAKTPVGTLALIVPLWAWWRRELSWRRTLAITLPLVGMFAAAATGTIVREHSHSLAEGVGRGLPFGLTVLVAGRAVWSYVAMLLAPANLMAIYPKWPLEGQTMVYAGYLLATAVLLVLLWALRGRIGRGPLFAALFYGVMLAPALGFVDYGFMVYSYVADHFVYLPSIGVLGVVGAFLARCAACLPARVRPALSVVGAILLLAPLAALTAQQATVYRNGERFWTYNLERHPTRWAYSALGDIYLRRGEREKNRELIERSIGYQQRSLLLEDNVRARVRLGNALLLLGRGEEALPHYQRALEINRKGGRLRDLEVLILTNLGAVHINAGRRAVAIECLEQAVKLDPRYKPAQEYLQRARGG